MKKIITLIIVALIAVSAFAQVVGEKSGKVYSVKFYKEYADTLTMERAVNDFKTAINEALVKKCTTLSISDNDGIPWMFVVGKENLEDVDTQVAKFKAKIDEMKSLEFVADGTRVEKTKTNAKYRSETYLNGKLIDSYESDWNSGYFQTTTSKYTSGGDTYITKTFYVAPKTTEKEITTGTSIVIDGIVNFAKKVYFNK